MSSTRNGWSRFCWLAAAAVLAQIAVPVYGQAPAFTKTLKKVNGASVTTQPASLGNGTQDWSLTYQFNQSAQVNIQDLIAPPLQYVPGSLQVPPSWTRQWFDGSAWVTAEPAAAQGVGAFIGFPHVSPSGTSQTVLVPAPAASSLSTSGSAGDGYRAIPYGNMLCAVNHHNSGNSLDCFDVTTGLRLNGFPAHVPLSAGGLFNSGNDYSTPDKPIEYMDRTNGRLYFPVVDLSGTMGILAADLNQKQSLGFHALPVSGVTLHDFSGIGGIGGKVYVQLHDGKIACWDSTTMAACPGEPYPVLSGYNQPQTASSSEIIGGKIYSVWPTSTSPYFLTCFDPTIPGLCAGWGANPKTVNGTTGILYPLLSGTSTATVTGICVNTTANGSGLLCVNPATGSVISPPATFANWVNTYGGGYYQTVGFGQTGYYQNRVFNSDGSAHMGGYDFTTQAPIGGLFPLSGITTKHYATIADPERPGCMWYDGDDGKLGSFQAANGRPCDSTSTVDTIVTPASSYCADGDASVTGWGKLSLTGLTLGGGITATLTIYDGSNPASLAINASSAPYAQNLPVTSLPLNLGAGGLNIGYGTGPGKYKSLRIVLQINGVGNHTPWTQSPPPNVEISWIGGAPQFCFQTRIATCSGAVVTNQAKAVTTPLAGSTLNNVAPVPAFSAVHEPGEDCPANLTVTKNLAGAPAGFTGTFKFYVTCSTPNGLLQQTLSITWPNTSVTLTGIPSGSVCTVSEDPNLPTLPAGSSWSGVPVSSPADGVIQIKKDGKNQITFTNTAHTCNDAGTVKITKRVEGVPPGFTGTFNFNVTCWSGTTLITKQAQITLPGSATVTVSGIPTGSLCTVTETTPLPSLPAGWLWLSPSYQPASGQVSLVDTCCSEIVVIDRAKFCCGQQSQEAVTISHLPMQGGDETTPCPALGVTYNRSDASSIPYLGIMLSNLDQQCALKGPGLHVATVKFLECAPDPRGAGFGPNAIADITCS